MISDLAPIGKLADKCNKLRLKRLKANLLHIKECCTCAVCQPDSGRDVDTMRAARFGSHRYRGEAVK